MDLWVWVLRGTGGLIWKGVIEKLGLSEIFIWIKRREYFRGELLIEGLVYIFLFYIVEVLFVGLFFFIIFGDRRKFVW